MRLQTDALAAALTHRTPAKVDLSACHDPNASAVSAIQRRHTPPRSGYSSCHHTRTRPGELEKAFTAVSWTRPVHA